MDRDLELRKRRGGRILLGVLAVWGSAVAIAAEAGLLRAIPPFFLAAIIALGIIVPVVVYAMSGGFRAYISAVGLRSITAFHVWRIAAALVFFWYGENNLLPETFVQNAGIGDLIAGGRNLRLSRSRYRAIRLHAGDASVAHPGGCPHAWRRAAVSFQA